MATIRLRRCAGVCSDEVQRWRFSTQSREVPAMFQVGRIVALVATIALTACAATPADPIHSKFRKRDPLPSCGELELAPGDALKDHPDEVACMHRALKSGAGA